MKTRKNNKKCVGGAFFAVAVLASSALTAYAADGSQSQSMELTVQKNASYIMTIPQDQNIDFGAVDTEIGTLSVKGEIGTNQKVKVSVSKTDFTDTADETNHFSFTLRERNTEFQEKEWGSQEVKANTASAVLTVHIPGENWGKTSPATYRAAVTFQASLMDGK